MATTSVEELTTNNTTTTTITTESAATEDAVLVPILPKFHHGMHISAEVTPPYMAQRRYTLSQAQVIRLYNGVVASNVTGVEQTALTDTSKSMQSFGSTDETGTCRICRWSRSDFQVLRCPCLCKGSVGFIHLQCLKRWMLVRRKSRCEICNAHFNIPEERMNFRRMFNSFFSRRCCGAILKNLLFCASLVPLTHVILQQVLTCMEKLNSSASDMVTLKEVLMGTFALLTSSAVFFHFFEFITLRFLHCRHVFRRWWLFGNTPEFLQMELDDSPSDFF